MFEARDTERLAAFGDRRMWRLLLARLHPDAGGDHELFTFACGIRDEVSGGNRAVGASEREDSAQSMEGLVPPFLRTWQDAMGHWSSCNRDALKDFWTR